MRSSSWVALLLGCGVAIWLAAGPAGGGLAHSTDHDGDCNSDGAKGLDERALTLGDATYVATAGPSGLACAGTIPCP